MKSERDFRNYLAGAALAFGIVLLTVQLMYILMARMTEAEIFANESLFWNGIYLVNLIGGGLGGFLVARHRQKDFIQTGTVVSILAYIFETIYRYIVEYIPMDIWSCVSLLLGGIFGSMFYKARTEKARIIEARRT